MAPAAEKPVTRPRQPLAASRAPSDPAQLPSMIDIFNNSQHVKSAESALIQLQKLYKVTPYKEFNQQFRDCIKKLFQSKQTGYFKTSCETLCKFLKGVSELSDQTKTKESMNIDSDSDEDPLIKVSNPRKRKSRVSAHQTSSIVTDHDRIVRTSMEVADIYMTSHDEECRLNAVFFISILLEHVNTLDEVICKRLKTALAVRVRDKKQLVRAQAVIASKTFQHTKKIQEAFRYHFQRDPDILVRKQLLRIMDSQTFGYDFLIDSTQDKHEFMRKAAFQRLGKISPKELDSEQLHRVIRNGLNEDHRLASFHFKTNTLEPWLTKLYDGIDLCQLLQSFNVLDHHEVVCRLLELIYDRNLDDIQDNGATTKLHQVAESFRNRWLNADNNCLPNLSSLDENVSTIWMTLVKFCKAKRALIKSVKVRTVEQQIDDPNESIEKILDTQERTDEVAELFERLTPDLVNLVDFLKKFVHHADQVLKDKKENVQRLEFVYHEVMSFISSYEIGDDLERKTVQEVFGNILKENLLTCKFDDFITPIIKCLHRLIYSSNSNLMIDYISELINNVRSHLEDLIIPTQAVQPASPSNSPAVSSIALLTRSGKKARIEASTRKRRSHMIEQDNQNLEYTIATKRVELHELGDKQKFCIDDKNFDEAKALEAKISDLKTEIKMLQNRRCSMASDISHMSMIIETKPSDNDKFSSTMIAESPPSPTSQDNKLIFKHHTNELLKCLHMYLGCLQCVKITEVPITMLNHLDLLAYESLDQWFKDDSRVRSLIVACVGLTALVDKNYAQNRQKAAMIMLKAGAEDPDSFEVKTAGFKCLVDVVCEHDDLEDIKTDWVDRYLKKNLREYDRYNNTSLKKNELDFATAIVEGSSKLLYLKKLSSPDVLSHLIIWWYHPNTHSKLKQFIGLFLITFVNDMLKERRSIDDLWLEDLLEVTFVCSIEHLHGYILGPKGSKMMAQNDMFNLITFLCNLVPLSMYQRIVIKIDERIDELKDSRAKERQDLIKYLEKSKSDLAKANKEANDRQQQQTLGFALPTE